MSVPTLIVEVGFTAGASTQGYLTLNDRARGLLDTGMLGADDIWTDISAYVLRAKISRGVNRVESPILRYNAGQATIDLDNSDRRFDPTNLSGPYVATGVTQVTPMRAVRILASWAGITYELFRGFADSWELDYFQPNYAGCRLQATDGVKVLSAIDRQAGTAVGASENAGTRISRILNSASWPAEDRIIATGDTTLQSTTLAGRVWEEMLLVQDTEAGEVYVDGGGRVVFRNRQASLEEQRSISAQACFGDIPVANIETTINLARNPSAETDLSGWEGGGFANPPTLTRSNTRAMFGTWSVLGTWATASGSDLPQVQYTVSGLTAGTTYTVSVYAYVPSGSPFVAIFVPTIDQWGDNIVSVADTWQRLTWTGVAISSSMLVQIWPYNSITTSGQEVYLDGLQVEEGATASTYCDGDQASSEWDGTAHASTSRRIPELPYADVMMEYDDTTIANQVMVTRVGGSTQTLDDATSQQLYLLRTFTRDDLIMETDTAAFDYGQYMLYQTKEPELRFTTLKVLAQRDEANLWPQVLTRDFGDRIRIKRRPPGGGTITREVFIRGISHVIEPDHWAAEWALQSTTKLSYLVLDHATLGQLDNNALSY